MRKVSVAKLGKEDGRSGRHGPKKKKKRLWPEEKKKKEKKKCRHSLEAFCKFSRTKSRASVPPRASTWGIGSDKVSWRHGYVM